MQLGSAVSSPLADRDLRIRLVVALGLIVQYWLGPRTVLSSVGARDVDASEYPDLHAAVTRLSSQIDVAKPGIAVIRSDVPNAFAVAGGGSGRVRRRGR